ncbi:M28 family peptidase [Neotamlana laminarinivorans]|uniref:M28 family peptidase n=1 Tax=Neotamlana laminarinivorans TaxID=2883124 RepID=A0A9X1HZK1_9FLAO|nr:M28 family peptidase [Tamlana laminarinivorans]MCB4799054.1 M28 family peptidase [Tamlana laminarinivorans]
MIKKYLAFYIFLLIGKISISQNTTSSNLFNETETLKHLQTLSSDAFEGRRTGTKGALKAEKYIINQFYTHGVKPLTKKYTQPFSFNKGNIYYNAKNIIGFIEGTSYKKKYVIISAHYDHEGIKRGKIYNGADDNASGVAALFSLAEYFKNNRPKHSVILAAFDAEELSLQGSKYFVNNTNIPKENIMVNLNLDMISRSDKKELFAVGTQTNTRLKQIVRQFKNTDDFKLVIGHDGYDKLENWTYASDHANFHRKNIPFIYFGVEDHEDYHEPTDDYENIHPSFYISAIKAIINVFEDIDDSNF